jgi:hypothetical protein
MRRAPRDTLRRRFALPAGTVVLHLQLLIGHPAQFQHWTVGLPTNTHTSSTPGLCCSRVARSPPQTMSRALARQFASLVSLAEQRLSSGTSLLVPQCSSAAQQWLRPAGASALQQTAWFSSSEQFRVSGVAGVDPVWPGCAGPAAAAASRRQPLRASFTCLSAPCLAGCPAHFTPPTHPPSHLPAHLLRAEARAQCGPPLSGVSAAAGGRGAARRGARLCSQGAAGPGRLLLTRKLPHAGGAVPVRGGDGAGGQPAVPAGWVRACSCFWCGCACRAVEAGQGAWCQVPSSLLLARCHCPGLSPPPPV